MPPAEKPSPATALSNIENAAFLRDAHWISGILSKAQTDRYYGKITLVIENGLTVRIVKEQSVKPPHSCSENGG